MNHKPERSNKGAKGEGGNLTGFGPLTLLDLDFWAPSLKFSGAAVDFTPMRLVNFNLNCPLPGLLVFRLR